MSVYDPEKTEDKSLTGDNNISDDKLRELMGIHKDEEGAMDREAHNGAAEDIARREKLGYDGSAHKAGKDEKSLLDSKTTSSSNDDDEGPSLFNDKDNPKKKRFRFKITGKQAAGGVAGVLGLGSIAGILMVSSGPLAFLHMSNLMQDFHHESNTNMQDGRLTKLWRYARGRGINNNLGRIGNMLVDKLDTRMRSIGIEPNYNNRSLTSFTFDTDNPRAKDALDKMLDKGYVPSEIDVNGSQGSGRYMQLDASRGIGSRASIRTMADDLRIARGESGIVSAVTHRLAKKRYAGGFHPLQNFYREAGESIIDYTRSVRQHQDDRVKTGVDAPDRLKPAPSQDELDADSRQRLRQDTPDAFSADTPSGVKAKLLAAVATTTGVVGLYELMCNVDKVGETIDDIRMLEIIQPLMRMGLDGLAMGAQIQFGQDVNSDELGALFTRFSGETDIGKLSAFASDSIQAELGNEPIGPRTATEGESAGQQVSPADLPASSKPGKDKPLLFKVADNIVNSISIGGVPLGDASCDVLTNLCIGTDDFSLCPADVADLIAAGLSGGTSAVAASLSTNALFAGAGFLFSDWIDSLIYILAGTALQCADGPQWGSCLNFGNRLNANDEALSIGGRELTENEEITLDNTRKELDRYDMKSKSLYARYLDPKETNSLFASAIFNNPRFASPTSSIAYAIQSPISNFGNIFSNVGNILGGRAKAASVDYDYGFPEYGFSFDEQTDDKYENPYEIAKYMEKNDFAKLTEMNNEYGNDCFKTTISTTGKIQTTSAPDMKDIPDKCKDTSNEDLMKYRFYIADTITAKSAACYEGADESACAELGFEDEPSSSDSTSTAGVEIVGDPFETSVDVECAEGTTDLGVFDGYTEGVLVPHRLCAVNNLPSDEDAVPGANLKAVVNSRVSGAVKKMVDDAASAGVELTSVSSFRSMEVQQGKWDDNVASGDCSETEQLPDCDVAKPGYSNHQSGTAIDFAVSPSGSLNAEDSNNVCTDRMRYDDSPKWMWLFENAENYGYTQLAYEAWHWDPATGPSKCNSSQP